MKELRHLNFDDLYLLKYLALGYNLTDAAKELHLSQPALSQRIKKIETVFDLQIIRKDGRKIHLTKEGELLCRKSIEALAVMSVGHYEKQKIKTVNIGTRAEVGRSWLWPAISNLQHNDPTIRFHLSVGSGEEILANLGSGRLDAVLTSAPHMVREYGAIDIAEERYVWIACIKHAKKITSIEDLKNYVLIEHDRSFPFQRYLPASVRNKIKFSDVWFIESSELMLSAIANEHGVGIIPEYLLKNTQHKNLKILELDTKLSTDYFRFIYRKDRTIERELFLLVEKLKEIGLQ